MANISLVSNTLLLFHVPKRLKETRKTSVILYSAPSLLIYMSFVPTCLNVATCLRALIFHVRAYVALYIFRAYVRSFFTSLRAYNHLEPTSELTYPADVKSDEN